MSPFVPLFVLSGFLGSGKTTLLNAVLKSPGFANTAVIVNEFGEIGLDHLLVERSSDNVVLLAAGCLCCTIADSLHETLADLNFRKLRGEIPRFERVIIETTGLADPAPILNTLLGNRLVTDHYRLDSLIVTVDAQNAMAGLAAHPEVAKQMAVADRLIVTKLDLVDSTAELVSRLTHLNPGALLLNSRDPHAATAAFAAGDCHRVLRALAPAGGGAQAHAHATDVNRHDARIRAHCFVVPDAASWAGIAAWWRLVSELYGDRLLRCKGLVRIADTGEIVFLQGVQRIFHRPERMRDWPDADHRSRLVCIGRDLDEAQLQLSLDALQLQAGSEPNFSLADLKLKRSQA